MDYYKLYNRIARKLNSGELNIDFLPVYIEKELKIPERSRTKDLEKIRKYSNWSEKYHTLIRNYKVLYKSFFELLQSFEKNEGGIDPFTMKFLAYRTVERFDVLHHYKEDVKYDEVLIIVIRDYCRSPISKKITKEYIKALDKKYLTDAYTLKKLYNSN